MKKERIVFMGVKEPNRYNLNLSEDVSKWLEQQKKSTGKSYLVGYNICETENKIGVSLQNSKQKKLRSRTVAFFVEYIFV